MHPELGFGQKGLVGLKFVCFQVVEDEELEQEGLIPLQGGVHLLNLFIKFEDFVHFCLF